MAPRYKHVIVVGASAGIGAELVLQLAAAGSKVAALARREEPLKLLAAAHPGSILPIMHDVTDFDSVPAVFESVAQQLGGCDLMIYSSGVMPTVGPAEFDFAKDRQMFEVNVLGGIAWLDAVAERFQSTGSGTIVMIGSVAGDRGRRGQPGYNASKAAVAAFAEALRNRLSGKGVTVTTVKPGPVQTELVAALGFKNAMPVADAAARIIRLAPSGREVYLKFSHRVIFAVIRLMPSWIFRHIPI